VTADLDVLRAAQAKADAVIRALAEAPGAGPMLRVSVTDPATGRRLATGFVSYEAPTARHLRPVS
jgi:hypothetical protein